MDDISVMLSNAWERRFGNDYNSDKRQNKWLVSPQGEKSFEVSHSKKMEEWYQSSTGKARYNKPKCFFCEQHDEYIKLDKVMNYDHLNVFYNKKFAERCHFLISSQDHRELLIAKDIITLSHLAQESKLSIFGNFRRSGASYPQHVHYQSLEKILAITLKNEAECIYSDNIVKVKIIEYPELVFVFYPVIKTGLNKIAITISKLYYPYNPLFFEDKIYLTPRIKSFPSNINGFKFAAAEVFACIYARTKEQYQSFTYKKVLLALNEVCFKSDSKKAEELKEQLYITLKEV